ncbi:MAG: ShlB/FhaC/HecB family hemolysin secretion/activation protein, partial [Anaerolineae bacterium]|nr:ShlB/FhaC/HecB family hemolysin secretion/activation protein [Phycisphaerae bacterium]
TSQPAPTSQPSPDRSIAAADSIMLREVRFVGNTVFSSDQLRKEVKSYIGRRITPDELEDARVKLTKLYIARNYITSGVILPDQEIDPDDAVVTFEAKEGKLARPDVKLEGVDAQNQAKKLWLRRSFIIDRIMAGAGRVLNIDRLKDRLELLRQNANIKRINAELEPGTSPGQSILNVKVEETSPFHFGIEFSNRRPPSVGANRFELFGSVTDLTGNGDALGVRYTINKGQLDDWEWAGLDEYSIFYSLPLNASDTTLELSYQRDDSPVVESPFDELDITSKTDTVFATIRQPIFRTTTADFDYREFAVSLGIGFRQNTSQLLGEPFSFSPGAVGGRTKVAPLRFGQEVIFRNQSRAISFRSTFNLGVDLFGATMKDDSIGGGGVDSQYLAWLGQFQYVWRIPKTDHLLIFRTAGQLANDSLPSLEQFSVGGMDIVRGYRENQLVRDQAIVATLEYRLPILHRAGQSILELAPFIDAGYARDVHELISNDTDFISSAGIGLLFHPNEKFSATIYYGYGFKDFGTTSDLQDISIHFDLIYQPF